MGKTLEEAKEAGIDARAVDVDDRERRRGELRRQGHPGKCRLVVDEERKVLVGATFVGFETADFLHAATIAVVGEVPMEKLWHAVPAYPSRSEVWLHLLEEYGL